MAGNSAQRTLLNADQVNIAVEVMAAYLNAPRNPDGRFPHEVQTERDIERARLIESELGPLVREYLGGKKPLDEFKSLVDGINKRNEHWGFKGVKGQMFFNMVVNSADDKAECDSEIKAAIALPDNEDIAKSRIRTFASYVRRLGDQLVDAGETKHKRPKPNSIPFFLTYFWQLQDRETWPVYYTNTVNTMSDLNLWQASGDLANDYIQFKHLHEFLGREFSARSKRDFGLYDVEHVFWFKGGNPFGESRPLKGPVLDPEIEDAASIEIAEVSNRLPDSYVPPIVAVLTRMALHDHDLTLAAQNSAISLERAFEKNVNAAFTILGYDAKSLGQGQGRVPDGLAIDYDNSYAIFWDSKVRKHGYSMGTDDRTIREYITTQSRELKKQRRLRNIYYAVISSTFKDDFDDTIRGIKMDTDVNEVCLIQADAIVALVDLKLRDPQQVTLGPDGVQRLLSVSGVIDDKCVKDYLG